MLKRLSASLITASIFTFFANPALSSQDTQSFHLQPEQRVTMVLAKNKKGGEKAKQIYLDGVFALAGDNQFKALTYFPVKRKLAGEHQPEVFALFAWQNAAASHQVRQHPRYKQSLKPIQQYGWDELAAADIDLRQASTYQFDQSKTYTLAEVWLNDPAQYDIYYQGTKALRKEMGAKVVFKVKPNEYTSLKRGEAGPDFLIMIEWQTPDDPLLYPQASAFKQYEKHIAAGIAKLGWYELDFTVAPATY